LVQGVHLARRILALDENNASGFSNLGYALRGLGQAEARMRRFDRAAAAFREAAERAREAAERGWDQATALDLATSCLRGLGDAYRELGLPAVAVEAFANAAEAARLLGELTKGTTDALNRRWTALDAMADAWFACLEDENALAAHRKAEPVARRLVAAGGGTLEALHSLGTTLFGITYHAPHSERVDEGVSAGREGVSVQRRIVALEPEQYSRRRQLATMLQYLSGAEIQAADLEAARSSLDEAMDILRRPAKDDDPAETCVQRIFALKCLAWLEEEAGRAAAARDAYDHAFLEARAALEAGDEVHDLLQTQADLHLRRADFETQAKCHEAAGEHSRQALELLPGVVDRMGEDWMALGGPLNRLDWLCDRVRDSGDVAWSLQLRREWVALHRRVASRPTPSVETLEMLASALRQLMIELDSTGETREASDRRQELMDVEARLSQARSAAPPLPTIPAWSWPEGAKPSP
jgi:tetratricopeptide (TPR) repeat protein